ncbi:apolipoprotein N-acyltransferase [Shimia sp. R10_1]|uniref:apolipoprotein N-acyltransferase n=1 Tax=Shimia sp. R10_1 TaxID=2821095 RepID=UPI001AD9D1B2|nr:apolipoprotein N-acyltransferase [Shimia sp. R10_1]MBO9475331.1 apolipoprotein N-acyltransferase [Shimia sp. R10_1]
MADTQSSEGRRGWRTVPFRIAAGGALLGSMAGLGHPPFDLWWATLLSFAAVFYLLHEVQRGRESAWLGLGFGTGYFAMSLHWIVEPFFVDPLRHGWMAPFAIVFMAVGLALFWMAAFWGAKRLHLSGWPVVLTLTGAELARAYVLSGFPWGMPSYVLVDRIAGQGAAFVGPHGLNLLLFAVGLALGLSLVAKRGRRLLAPLGIAGAVALAGPMPTPEPIATDDRPVVRLVQPNAPQHQKWDPEYTGIFFERLVRASAAGDVRPDLIVWPETAVPVLLNYAEETLQIINRSAAGVPVVLGINRFEGLRIHNAAVLLDASGTVAATYDKHHLVPFGEYIPLGNLLSRVGIAGFASQNGEGFSPGPGPALMDLGALGKALMLICYEAVFPQDVFGAPARPDFILHLTNDAWFGSFSGPFQHLAQARMRAIESGLPVLRAANTGVSAVIDAQGRVLESLPLNTEGYLDAALPKPQALTLYARTGDWLCFAVVVLLICAVALTMRRNSD